jgi:hypothetical protein
VSAAKHTPGPWAVEGSWSRPVTGEVGHIISYGVNSNGDGPQGTVCKTVGTSLDVARLIAAAPDLLEALKPFAAELGFGEKPSPYVLAARAAIAKAEGAQ